MVITATFVHNEILMLINNMDIHALNVEKRKFLEFSCHGSQYGYHSNPKIAFHWLKTLTKFDRTLVNRSTQHFMGILKFIHYNVHWDSGIHL